MKRYLSLIIAILAIQTNLFAAEAGMPQLDPTYWASQAFWLILVFGILYISIAKFYLPKIKNNLDDRDNKIKEDLDSAYKFKELSELKLKEYEKILDNSKKEVIKIHLESKNKLDKDIQTKKSVIEKEIEAEITKAQKEIAELKKNSISDIQNISKDLASSIIENISGEKLNESSIKAAVALTAVVLMFVIPNGSGGKLLDWESASTIHWGVLLLFAGGIAIAKAFAITGISTAIGDALSGVTRLSIIVVIAVVAMAVTFLTEITSNTATTALLMPILAAASLGAGFEPALLMLPAALSASCAFMLPVATGPNAIVFGTGKITVEQMVREGLVLNLIGILVITAVVYFWLGNE